MNSTDVFNQLKSMTPAGKIRQEQVDTLYEILGKGVTIEKVLTLLGKTSTDVELQKPASSQTQDSKYKLSQRSLDRLIGVNPTLVKVVKRAIEISDIDFMVVEGLRTKETQAEYVKKGVSKTMNSYHLTGHAVDLAPVVNGKIDWNNIDEFKQVAKAMKTSAKESGVSIEHGGDWKTFKDYPHYQTNR